MASANGRRLRLGCCAKAQLAAAAAPDAARPGNVSTNADPPDPALRIATSTGRSRTPTRRRAHSRPRCSVLEETAAVRVGDRHDETTTYATPRTSSPTRDWI